MPTTYEHPHIRFTSNEFDCEGVRVREVTGKEAVGRLFSFDVDLVCADGVELALDAHLGATASLVFEIQGQERRTVHGLVSHVEDRLDSESSFRSYRLRLAPRAYRATLVETQQVFLDISVPDLIQQKLALLALGGEDVAMRLFKAYPPREMIVQYKETDLAFISRLCEHLGISFFFEHETGRDVMVFTDQQSGFAPLPRGEIVPFRRRGEEMGLFSLASRSEIHPRMFAMQEYNYRVPTVEMTALHEASEGFAGAVVEYGGHYKTPPEGQELAAIRAEERRSSSVYLAGKSDECRMIPGAAVKLEGHPRLDGASFVVVEVEHHATQLVGIEGGDGREQTYQNAVRLVAKEQPYRPPRITPRPRMHGVVTAWIEPQADGEIGKLAPLDEQGRYTVRFAFDASSPGERAVSSRPTRMIQPHAGPNYGVHFPLKPGIEVLMIFMDGDPDRPLILGAAPNPITPTPVAADVNLMHRIETSTGIIIEMRDCPPRA